jgi:predicted TIM-barrel fold metal-dependent hydrolase
VIWVNHCHLLPSHHHDKEVPVGGTIDAWLHTVAPRLGIERAVAFAPFPHQLKDGNDWLASVLPRYPQIVGCATIHPLSPNAPQRLKHFVEEHGFVAAKLHPPVMKFRVNDPEMDPYYTMAARLGIPITFHTGVHGWRLRDYEPMLFDDVAERHPDLKIIMAHVGGTAQFNQALAVLQNRKNVYAELAQTRRILRGYCWHLSDENINMLLKSIGPHRIIYGTDWPWANGEQIDLDIQRIRSWDITDAEKAMILGGNLRQLLPNRQASVSVEVFASTAVTTAK